VCEREQKRGKQTIEEVVKVLEKERSRRIQISLSQTLFQKVRKKKFASFLKASTAYCIWSVVSPIS